MAATTQTRTIRIKVDAAGVKEALDGISKSMGGISKNTQSLASNLGFLKNAFLGYLSSLGIRELASMSDQMQNLSNRIKIVSRVSEDNNETMSKLLKLADETKLSVGDVGEVYARLGTSLKSANASADSMIEITKALINSFRISGSTGNETTATIIQLSQAFASGTLRGQELRSVMLQNAELASLLRQRFGKNLAKDAEAGLISIVEVLKLLYKNQDRINKQSETLTITFEQSLTKATNKLRAALFELNNEFQLSTKFSLAIDVITERMGVILTVVGVLALTRIPQLITAIAALSKAMFALALSNPITAALTAISVAILLTSKDMIELGDNLRLLGSKFVDFNVVVLETAFSIEKSFAKGLSKIGLLSKDTINKLALDLDHINQLKDLSKRLSTPTDRGETKGNPAADAAKLEKDRADILAKLGALGGQDKLPKVKEVLAEINKEFLKGTITASEYNNKLINFELYKLNREFKEGKIDLFKYNEGIEKIKEADVGREFDAGRISLTQFNDQIAELKIEELNSKFEAGRITLVEYNKELVNVSRQFEPGGALIAGTQAYIDSIGTTSSNVADAIKETFGALETSLLDFIKRGKFNFADFTQAILDDLAKIIIRATIIRPLAEGILSFGSSGSSSVPTASSHAPGGQYASPGFAHGGIFDKGLKKFAGGGIINSPTAFGFGSGQKGLAGEAGPEAILPLRRGSGGDLGVAASITPVTVNVINQSGNEVQQSEKTGPNGEKTIEILVTNKVREGIVSGKFDSAFKQSYGINRKGS